MEKIDTDFYDIAYQWLITYGPKIVIAIIVLIVGQWLIKMLRRWSRRFFVAPRFEQVRPFLDGLIAVLLQILLVLLLMQILGIQLTVFTAIIASIGVTAGLALSGTLQNLY